MPYVLIARTDIPDGLLQSTLDLKPGTSQRRFPYQKVGQNRYGVNTVNETGVVITAGVTDVQIAGLTAWLLGSISSSAGTNATSDITTVAVASLVDGDFFTVSDGVNTSVYEFVVTATHGVTSGRVAVDVSGDTDANEVRDTLLAAINADTTNDISAADGGAATVTMTNNNQNQLIASQNATNSENVANAGFLVPNFAGAANSDPLTAAEASTDADDLIAVVAAGTALTKGAINTALTTGVITEDQVSEILDVLAGRNFELPAASNIGTAQFASAGAFDDTEIPFRRLYATGAFRSSWESGRLSLARAAAFSYGGVTGAAVSIYTNEGLVFSG